MEDDMMESTHRTRENKEWMKEEIKENWDDWADQIAREYEHKRKAFYQLNGHSKKTATAGLGTGKRGKEGRRNKKERERKEFLDHQKRRVDNYIRAQVSYKTVLIKLAVFQSKNFLEKHMLDYLLLQNSTNSRPYRRNFFF